MLTGSVPRSHPTLSDSQPPNLHRIWTWKRRISIVTWSNPAPNGILRETLAWRCHIIASLDTLRRSSRHKLILLKGRSRNRTQLSNLAGVIHHHQKSTNGIRRIRTVMVISKKKFISPVHRINHTPRFPHRKNKKQFMHKHTTQAGFFICLILSPSSIQVLTTCCPPFPSNPYL